MIKAKEWIIDYNSELNKKGPFYYANAQSNIESVKEVTNYLIDNNIKEISKEELVKNLICDNKINGANLIIVENLDRYGYLLKYLRYISKKANNVLSVKPDEKTKDAAETLISNIDRAIEVAKDYYAVSGYQQFTRTLMIYGADCFSNKEILSILNKGCDYLERYKVDCMMDERQI